MKKMLCLLLVALILVFSAGCSKPAENEDGEKSGILIEPNYSGSETSAAEPDEKTEEDHSKPEEESKPSEPETSSKPQEEAPKPAPAEPTWWSEGLAKDKLVPDEMGCGQPHSRGYIYDDIKKIANDAVFLFSKGDSDYKLELLLDSAKEVDDIGERILPDNFYEINTLDDTKYLFEFYEKGVSVTESLPGEGKGKKALAEIDEDDYQEILDRIPGYLAGYEGNDEHYPSWLAMMRRSRALKVTYYTADGTEHEEYDISNAPSSWMWDDLYPLVIGGGEATEKTSLPDAARAELSFNNGLVYNIYCSDTQLLICASDVSRGRLYDLRFEGSSKKTYEYNAKGQLNPPTGKPVIYLYPTEPTECFVTVDYGEFETTIPEYKNGRNVLAYPDGRLVNAEDGAEYPYLFWDGNKTIDFDFSEGFCVARDELEDFLREKLTYLGLVPAEYEEFIEYWLPRMQQSPYYVINFAGEEYENAAPLKVYPKPDNILRVHMAFYGVQEPVSIPEQKLEHFTRSGFTVVEWGGSDASRMEK